MKASEILDSIRKQNELLTKEEAVVLYDRQKKALSAIRNTQWLEEIRSYFYRLYDTGCSNIERADVNNTGEVASYRSEMKIARDFLSFLDNMVE